jgi:hypothetical protein
VLQVLLTNHSHSPVTLWVDDECEIGDQFKWGEDVWKVSAVYGTLFPSFATEVRKREKPRPSRSDYAFPIRGD